ncbi:MAG: asparagine synthase (glutamine-hydrolyzing) [Nitrospinae bacterium RIFCSPLOWO2_12_FULL_45_22]|nr:MAG: asparagine synthase (glutamine-hydrolyzing) [Nitrospinae bacterium RIFCSPLOWO2_12_FULL_45_22]
MCGIAGIISDDSNLYKALPKMLALLAHRGPDDEGIEYLNGAALGHRRLSIIDLDGGHQPMFFVSKPVAIVFNGEIYNFPVLKRQLEAEGRRFNTRSDTEVILHLYEKYGADCVKYLDGMFAIAIWDETEKKLVLARDHLGQKPLFFCEIPCGLAFASEVKGLLESNFVKRETDLEALYHYISLRFVPDQFTLFKGIKKLPAAHRLIYEKGKLRIERYWEFSYLDKINGTEEEITDQLDFMLFQTVKDHMLSDVPVGSFLSGGIDSSLITAMMARQSEKPVSTFSIGVKEQDFNELPFAKLLADQYKTQHHEQVVQADLIHLLPKMIWHLDEPSDPFGVGIYLVSQLAAKHVKVVLSGDGGDELFAGYDRFSGNHLANIYCVIPRFLRKSLLKKIIEMVPDSFTYKSFSQKLRWLNEMSLLDHGDRYAESMSFLRYTEEAKSHLFTEWVKKELGYTNSREKILVHFNCPNVNELVDRMLYTDLMTRMPDHLLMIVDRMAMAHSLEVRPPLLEHKMVEFAARIPANLKLNGVKLKYILRKVASRYIDPSLVTRKKQGFGFPLAYWMRKELKPFLRNIVKESRFIEHKIFDHEYVHNMTEEHIAGKRDHNFRIWIFMNLEIWYRLFIEQQSFNTIQEWINKYMRMEYRDKLL